MSDENTSESRNEANNICVDLVLIASDMVAALIPIYLVLHAVS